jgi:anaerobic selenocysteine-containing dehydrogenase
MSNTLADEILAPGPGRVRALIVDGGNPLSALPDQRKAAEAFRQLDLLVTIDPLMSATARLSHYVLPPKVLYEREDLTAAYETAIYPQPFAQHAPALVPPPEGAEVVDDGLVYWALAQRLGLMLQLGGQPLDMRAQPAMRELLERVAAGSAVDVREVFDRAGGRLFDVEPQTVAPADADSGRFDLAPDDVRAEIDALRREPVEHGAYREGGLVFTHRLAVRRLREAVNTSLRDAPAVRKRMPGNAAQLHPDDLAALGLAEGERALIRSAHGELMARVEADTSLKPGVVTLAHGWGGLPEDGEDEGVNVNRLISAEHWIEPINAMARMTGVPVTVTPILCGPGS